jgi:hypothetical protein
MTGKSKERPKHLRTSSSATPALSPISQEAPEIAKRVPDSTGVFGSTSFSVGVYVRSDGFEKKVLQEAII